MRTLTASLASVALLAGSAYADPVHNALDAYALYQNDVSALLDHDVDSGRLVDAALARLSRHDPASLARGWVAYGALTAAQAPAFAGCIQRHIRDEGRTFVVRQLEDDITYARRQQNGSGQAVQLILDAASADGARANLTGARYETFARSGARVQLVSSVLRVDLPSARLTPAMLARLHVGALAGQPASDTSALGGRGFWNSLAGRDERPVGSRGGRERQVYAPVTDHMLTLGALIVAGDSDRQRESALLNEPITLHCMQMQQLELRQCLTVSHNSADRAYCVGHHALSGVGSCVSAMVR
jgi:hypothetical protein